MVWLKFVVCVAIIFISGRKVARYGDIIAEKTGLGGVWIGLVLIAALTSLPELFNGVSAVTLVNAPGLTIGNILGANMFNLFNLALLDLFHRNGSILSVVGQTHRLTGIFSLLMVSFVAVFILASSRLHPMGLGWIGWYTPFLILMYLVFVRVIYHYELRHPSLKETEFEYADKSLRHVYPYFSLAAVFIIGAGIWLAFIGDEIASVYGWEQSFVGSLFLAFSTTLPEITVSIAAMRIGAKDLAVSNLIGSNLFNITIIPLDDLLYVRGPILAAVSETHLVTAFTVMLMSVVFIIGLGHRHRRVLRLSWWNITLMVLFILGAYYSFQMA
ncbi:MAG: sodium:calcium antiporter [Chloroflexi bacterium]|nr:sodium:calcium antiporter [Chloroflexota bacterium]